MDGNVELCLNGNGKSCILAGHDYERINLDIKKAMIYYHHGCTIGYGLACLEEGIIYCNGRDEIVKDEYLTPNMKEELFVEDDGDLMICAKIGGQKVKRTIKRYFRR